MQASSWNRLLPAALLVWTGIASGDGTVARPDDSAPMPIELIQKVLLVSPASALTPSSEGEHGSAKCRKESKRLDPS